MGTCQPHICDVGVYVPQGEEILTFCTWEKSVSSEEDTPKLPRHPLFLPSYIVSYLLNFLPMYVGYP